MGQKRQIDVWVDRIERNGSVIIWLLDGAAERTKFYTNIMTGNGASKKNATVSGP